MPLFFISRAVSRAAIGKQDDSSPFPLPILKVGYEIVIDLQWVMSVYIAPTWLTTPTKQHHRTHTHYSNPNLVIQNKDNTIYRAVLLRRQYLPQLFLMGTHLGIHSVLPSIPVWAESRKFSQYTLSHCP